MQIRGEVADGGRDAGVESAAVGEVAAETHARGADSAGAGWQGEEVGDCEGGVFVVGGEGLDLLARRGGVVLRVEGRRS